MGNRNWPASADSNNSRWTQEMEDDSSSPLDAAIGIKNGLSLGGALWALSYLLFSLISYLS